MNRLTWIGVIVWGLLITGTGLSETGGGAAAAPGTEPHDLLFLLVGDIVSCLIGVVGLLGCMGWIPGLHLEQKSYS